MFLLADLVECRYLLLEGLRHRVLLSTVAVQTHEREEAVRLAVFWFAVGEAGKRKGQAVPRWGKNFLTWSVRPIARKLGIPDHLVTFRVMRRTLGTDMQKHGTLKDTQGILRHASITTTGDVYVQTIEQSVLQAVNSRTAAVLEGWTAPVETMGVAGRNLRGSSAKPREENAVSD